MDQDMSLCADGPQSEPDNVVTYFGADNTSESVHEDELETDFNIIKPSEYITHKRRIRLCVRSRPCYICLYLANVMLLLSGVLALAVVSILVVSPYQRTVGYVPATCSTERTSRIHADRRCACGKSCHSRHPCVTITVRVYPESSVASDNITWSARLAEDESILNRQVSNGAFKNMLMNVHVNLHIIDKIVFHQRCF